MRLGLGLVALLVVAPSFVGSTTGAAPTLASPCSGPAVAHPPISINSDADLSNVLNGVREGTGTPSDPFVICGWDIQPTDKDGIYLNNTRASVIITKNNIHDVSAAAPRHRHTAIDAPWYAGITIANASNVQILQNTIHHVEEGTVSTDPETLLDTLASDPMADPSTSPMVTPNAAPKAIISWGARNVSVIGNDVSDTINSAIVINADDARVENNTVTRYGWLGLAVGVWNGATTVVRGNVVSNGHDSGVLRAGGYALGVFTHAVGAVIQGNVIDESQSTYQWRLTVQVGSLDTTSRSGGRAGLSVGAPGSAVTENRVRGLAQAESSLWGMLVTANDVTIENNYVNGFEYGVMNYNASGTTIARNDIAGQLHEGVITIAPQTIYEDEPRYVPDGPPVDATNNYWGCPDGPGAAGCVAVSSNVTATPWSPAPNTGGW